MPLRHETIERSAILLLVLTLMTVAVGGAVEIVPLFTVETTVERVKGVRPYSPLELMGRNIYIREGCYLCHSQQIRALRDEVERYGHYSLAAESLYDHPFQWGSKRIGPDLARVGGKYSNDWHDQHLIQPSALVPETLMPSYRFLAGRALDYSRIADHLATNRIVGVPYTDEEIALAREDLEPRRTRRRTSRSCSSATPKPSPSMPSRAMSPSWTRSWPISRCSAPWSISPTLPKNS
jgi:cytochrome c oxidase cbb3-type subunit 2